MTDHKTVLLEGQARDDAAEIERLRRMLEVTEAACELHDDALSRAERAEAERDAALNRVDKIERSLREVNAEREALYRLAWTMYSTDYIQEVIDSARGKR